MMSLIRDNGLVSFLNRGTFFGCRDWTGHLEGVALVGHATLIESVSDRALRALARVARDCFYTHVIMGEQQRVAEFWDVYRATGQQFRLACRELLFELRWPFEVYDPLPGLSTATAEHLNQIMTIQAELAFQESGVNPLDIDPEGFRRRCLRRIEQGRTWILCENGSLIFKAEVMSKAGDVIYLEGVWVREDRRKDRLGLRCMSELSQKLLQDVKSICLLVNEANKPAQAFYRKCGFKFRATYETIFLSRKEQQFPH
jgi:GNAT superfamily N-acetyltransferase